LVNSDFFWRPFKSHPAKPTAGKIVEIQEESDEEEAVETANVSGLEPATAASLSESILTPPGQDIFAVGTRVGCLRASAGGCLAASSWLLEWSMGVGGAEVFLLW
jgi:hypothetical protein